MGIFLAKLLVSAYIAEFCLQHAAAFSFGQFFDSRYPKWNKNQGQPGQPEQPDQTIRQPEPPATGADADTAPIVPFCENRWSSLVKLVAEEKIADHEVGLLIMFKREYLLGLWTEYPADQKKAQG